MNDSGQDGQSHPLKGAVVCCTAINHDVRTRLGQYAEEMGGTHRLDLTTDVTHLICGRIETEKYRHVARERPDVCVVQPEWLETLHKTWMQGEDTDLEALSKQYRLQTFLDLNICLTGFDDLKQRQQIQDDVVKNGANYHGDLTKAVSHLIAARPQGAKYDRAKFWGIKIVSLKWFAESIARGMVVEERLYDPLMPEDAQGRGAFVRELLHTSIQGKRPRQSDGPSIADDAAKRKMRRTASTRLSSQSQNLWADISTTELVVPPDATDQWAEPAVPFAMPTTSSEPVAPPSDSVTPAWSEEKLRGLFSGWTCYAHGHAEVVAARIRQLLTDNGAECVDNSDDLYPDDPKTLRRLALILPSRWTSQLDADVPDVPIGTELVTEWWIERCILHKEVLAPQSDELSRSWYHLPAKLFTGMSISTSGLGTDVRMFADIVNRAGGIYQEELIRTTSVLVHNPAQSRLDKPIYAQERNIHLVTPAWLLETITSGKVQPFGNYALPSTVMATVKRALKESEPETKQPEAVEAVKRYVDTIEEPSASKPAHQRLSATRKRGVAPALSLARSLPTPIHDSWMDQENTAQSTNDTESLVRNNIPFREDTPSLAGSQPLDDLPPAMNSPRKPSQSQETFTAQSKANAESGFSNPRLDGTDDYTSDRDSMRENHQAPVTNTEISSEPGRSAALSRAMSDILARRQAGRPTNAEDPVQGRRRKDRKLGRAASGTGATASIVRPTPLETADSMDGATPLTEEDTLSRSLQPPLPSQQLTYDAPGAEEHRRLMSKKMGTTFTDEGGTRVQSIGVVRDADASFSGVGERVRGRHRDAKTR